MDGEGSKEGEGRTRERRKKGGREAGGRTEGRADGSVYRTGERPHWAPNCETERKERTGRKEKEREWGTYHTKEGEEGGRRNEFSQQDRHRKIGTIRTDSVRHIGRQEQHSRNGLARTTRVVETISGIQYARPAQ